MFVNTQLIICICILILLEIPGIRRVIGRKLRNDIKRSLTRANHAKQNWYFENDILFVLNFFTAVLNGVIRKSNLVEHVKKKITIYKLINLIQGSQSNRQTGKQIMFANRLKISTIQ